MKMQAGQIIMALILIMSVALAIGLSIVQKSLTDISTATKVEQSSRAFSAAEAGIEQALRGVSNPNPNFSEIQSSATVQDDPLLPKTATTNQQEGLEYPPLAKEEIAHFHLADLNSTTNPPELFYKPPSGSLEVYWGQSAQDKAAIQIKIIYYDSLTTSYKAISYFFDPDATRALSNNFTDASLNCGNVAPIQTTEGLSRNFYCKQTLSSLPANLMILRTRLFYNSTSQPVAVRAVGTCGKDCSLPPQTRIIASTGQSGETQRTIKLFQIEKVVPPYFDFVIFSAGEVNK